MIATIKGFIFISGADKQLKKVFDSRKLLELRLKIKNSLIIIDIDTNKKLYKKNSRCTIKNILYSMILQIMMIISVKKSNILINYFYKFNYLFVRIIRKLLVINYDYYYETLLRCLMQTNKINTLLHIGLSTF